MTIYINGRFLTQNPTGVQRYCRQVVTALDHSLRQANCPDALRKMDWILLAPPGTTCDLDLSHIRFKQIGWGGGHLWEQLHLARYSRKGMLLSMANSGPISHPRQMVVIHDAAIFFAPSGFAWRYRLLHAWLGRSLARTAQIVTVSEFSRSELARALNLEVSQILIAPNGADHTARVAYDCGVLTRLKLTRGKYFVTLGLSTANKNVELAMEAHRMLNRIDTTLVVAGNGSPRVAGSQKFSNQPGILMTGHLSDEELACLMAGAAAFVFPSRYEGFGIPPLEAMAQGCPVLASSTPAVVEVCGGAALHFHPDDATALATLMRRMLEEPTLAEELRSKGKSRPGKYRWLETSAVLMRSVHELAVKP